MMPSPKKLNTLARKWQKVASLRRKRMSLPKGNDASISEVSSSSSMAFKGHFVVYTTDQKRFAFPIAYLNNFIFRDLFRMSEEEFGLPSDGPITLPCDAVTTDHVVSLIQRPLDGNTERALLMSLAATTCPFSDSLHHVQSSKQILISSD